MNRISRLLIQKEVGKKPKIDANDPQKHLVYRMERDIMGWAVYAHVELDHLQLIADYACRKYGIKRVGITIVYEGKKRIFGWCEENTIHLNADYHGDNTAVLLHELAHYIVDQRYPDAESSHGPEFVYVYGELLDLFNCIPLSLFTALCDEHGVDFLGMEP